MIKDAEWALRQIEKHLPLGGVCSGRHCDCSADVVYYIQKIREQLKRRNKK